MIRYVLIVILAVAILGLSFAALDHAATKNSHDQLEADAAAIEQAATELIDQEEVPPEGQPPPRRVVSLSLPGDTMTTEPVDSFEIERIGPNTSVVRYRVDGGGQRQVEIGAPITHPDPDSDEKLTLDGGRRVELVLTLERDADDRPVVVATVD